MVNEAVNDCRFCVESFVQRNSKFKSLDSTLDKGWSVEVFSDRVRKVYWVVWEEEDVAESPTTLRCHTDVTGVDYDVQDRTRRWKELLPDIH